MDRTARFEPRQTAPTACWSAALDYLTIMTQTSQTCVLYNAECPVCSFEINHYAAYAQKAGLAVRFDDLNSDDLADWTLSPDAAARRLHVLKDGVLTAGIPAFLILWDEMPRYRWLARVVGLPGIRHLAIFGYDYVLAPLIYAWHRRRLRRRAGVRLSQS